VKIVGERNWWAIFNILVYASHRIELNGESLRKNKMKKSKIN
jgi:hypothetical protein